MTLISGDCAFSELNRTFRSGTRPLVYAVQCQKNFLLNFSVPQGSALGPILFIMYVSPVTRIARRHGLLAHFFADDSQLCVTVRPLVRGDETDIAGTVQTPVSEILVGGCWQI